MIITNEKTLSVCLDTNEKLKLFYYLAYFYSIQFIFVTIHGSYCHFLYYLWVRCTISINFYLYL